MKIISGGRGTGKTKKLIQAAAEVDGIIVCENPDAMIEKIHGYGIAGIRVISFQEYLTADDYDQDAEYFVDDGTRLFELVGSVFGKIGAATVCID